MSRETLGERHPDTLFSMSDLGKLLRAKGDFAAAEPLCREALAVRAESLAAEVAAAIEEHAIVQHPQHGRGYAYQVEGCTPRRRFPVLAP